MELEPLQKPHPPMWYGVHSVEAAERAARQGLNMVSLDSAKDTRTYNDSLSPSLARIAWRKATPKLGQGRFIVIAENGKEALPRCAPGLSDLAPAFLLFVFHSRR